MSTEVIVETIYNTIIVDDSPDTILVETPGEVTVLTAAEQGPPGSAGPQGPQGVKGDTGDNGLGIAVGGTTGQLLVKASNTNYDTDWVNLSELDIGELGLGTISTQDANAVAITGGAINNTVIGSATPNAATFTTVSVPTSLGQTTLLQNSTITGWIYSGKTLSVSAQETAPTGLFFSPDGLKMYINGSSGDDVNEYTLSTAWDITTATFVTVFSVSAQDTGSQDVFFKPDGLTMFIMGGTTDTVYQYTLTTAWDISTASYASKSFSVTTQETAPLGIWFKPDGLVMYIVGSTADSVFQYTLSTAWDVSTASYSGIFYSFAAQESAANQVNLSSNGLKMWVVGSTGDDIWEYTLGTAWDVSTATPVNNFYIGFQAIAPTGMFIDNTVANRVFITDSSADSVFQYNTVVNSSEIDTEKLYIDGQLSVNGNLVAGSNAYVDGNLTVQGTSNFTSISANQIATSSTAITLGGSVSTGNTNITLTQTTGLITIGGTTGTGAITLGQSTASQTTNIQAGATASGSTKAVTIGTGGLSGSTTNINIGSSVSGSLGTISISAPTVNIGQTATQFSIVNTPSAVNYIQTTGAVTGVAPSIASVGSDTNIDLILKPKGTGNIAVSSARITGLAEPIATTDATTKSYVDNVAASAFTAGAGLSLTGNEFNVGGTTDRITVNTDTIDIASTYVGQTSITTLGTIDTGTWNATTIDVAKGGTGLTTATTRGIIYGNGTSAMGVTAASTIDGSFLREDATGAPYWSNVIDGGTY